LHLGAVRVDGSEVPKQRCLTSMESESAVKFLELSLQAGESFELRLINALSGGANASEIVIEEIQAYRGKNPLWGWCGYWCRVIAGVPYLRGGNPSLDAVRL